MLFSRKHCWYPYLNLSWIYFSWRFFFIISPWLFGSGRFSRATRCITVVLPNGNCKAETATNDIYVNEMKWSRWTDLDIAHAQLGWAIPGVMN